MQKIIPVILLQIILSLFTTTAQSQTIQSHHFSTEKYAGTYRRDLNEKKDISDGAAFGEIRLYPETDKTMLFYASLSRGAPSYNIGEIAHRIKVVDGKASFREHIYNENYCTLTFEFRKGLLIVRSDEVENDCGFGFGVLIDGVYQRQSASIPESFIMGESSEPVYFRDFSKKRDKKKP